jgi:prevent-host-death family protein
MTVIPQKELRNQIGDVLRRVEAGETMIVTVSGRPVAELSPAHRRQWVSGDTLRNVWRGPTPHDLEQDLERMPAALVDPFTG